MRRKPVTPWWRMIEALQNDEPFDEEVLAFVRLFLCYLFTTDEGRNILQHVKIAKIYGQVGDCPEEPQLFTFLRSPEELDQAERHNIAVHLALCLTCLKKSSLEIFPPILETTVT